MRRLTIAAGVALALSAALSIPVAGAEKVMVQVVTIRASGDPKGEAPTFSPRLGRLRRALRAAYGGYKDYEYVDMLSNQTSLKAPLEFALKTGQTVSITVVEFGDGRFRADVELYSGVKLIGRTRIAGREGVHSYVAVSRSTRKKELIVIAFKVFSPPRAELPQPVRGGRGGGRRRAILARRNPGRSRGSG